MRLDRLAQLARDATPGPWTTRGVSIRQVREDVIGGRPFANTHDSEADAEFIAACDPATVAALVRAVQAAENVIDERVVDPGDMFEHRLDQLDAALALFRDSPGDAA